MNAFEQPLPKNPKEAGSRYFEEKKERAALEYEQEKAAKEQATTEKFAPFDKPLSPESKEIETSIEKKLRLLSGVISTIKKLEEELITFPEDIRPRTGQAHQIEELEVLEEQLLSQISPEELEKYMESPEENTN